MDLAGVSLLLIFLVGVALLFDFLNGLHDAANSIATVVSTRVLSPRVAVAWAAFFNFIAFLFFGLHVANTVGKGIISADIVSDAVIFGALGGAISWNVITWLAGIPSSSSHALIGGLLGAEEGGFGLAAIRDIVSDGLIFDGLAEAIFDGALRPLEPDALAVGEIEFAFEGGRAVAGEGEVFEKREKRAVELVAFAAEGAGVGAVDEGEATVGAVAADEVDLVLDDAAVARFDVLKGLGHVLDLASEADDFVGVVVVRRDVGGGGGRFLEGLDAEEEAAVPHVAAQHEEHAADDGEADDPICVAEAFPQVFLRRDRDERCDQAECQRKEQNRFAKHGRNAARTKKQRAVTVSNSKFR